MEIVVELVAALLGSVVGSLLEFILEVLIQALGGSIGELAGRWLGRRRGERPPVSAIWACIGYAALGAGLGAASLLLWPNHLMPTLMGRWAYLFLSPVVAGLAFAAWGAWRRGKGEVALRLDGFGVGWAFAFAFALARFVGAR